MTNKCEPPKTKLDKVLNFFKYFLRYLDKNKLEAVLFFGAILVWSVNVSKENIKILIDLLK